MVDGSSQAVLMLLSYGNFTTVAGQIYASLTTAAFTPGNDLLLVDQGNGAINSIASNGFQTTIAGMNSRQSGYFGVMYPAIDAILPKPQGIFVASDGTIYIADPSTNVVQALVNNGSVITIAGVPDSLLGYAGDGGPAVNATLNYPTNVAVQSVMVISTF